MRGRRRSPPGKRVFADAAFETHFKPILDHYRRKRQTLVDMRTLFNRLAEGLAALVKRAMDDDYASGVYRQTLRGVPNAPRPEDLPRPCHYDRAHLARVLGHPKGGAGAGRRVFDPWNGRWQGKWTSGPDRPPNAPGGPNPSPQHHVWDEARESGGATVQPVSQSETGFVDGGNIDAETAAGRTDLGINVYDDEVGVGGWVSKRQRGESFELPHIGFRVAPGVLVWITRKHNRECQALEDAYFVYFEWVDEEGRYGILGKRIKVDGNTVRGLTANESYDGERHGGVYGRG